MAQLNVNGQLVLAAQNDRAEKGVILLSEQLGDYSAHYSDNLELNRGDKIHFNCPACAHTLEYKQNKNLARVLCEDGNGPHTVIFSAIFGENSTYQINEERTLSYGEHAFRYMDPDWYKKLGSE